MISTSSMKSSTVKVKFLLCGTLLIRNSLLVQSLYSTFRFYFSSKL